MSLELFGDGRIKVNGVISMTFAPGPIIENGANITSNVTITANNNAMSAGPITIDDGVEVTVPAGSEWTVV